jgi:hypothetical protein
VSLAYRFHPEARLALLRGERGLTQKEWEETAREVLAGKNSGATWRILSDRRLTGDSYPPWMEDRLVGFIREYAPELGEIQWAVVVSDQASLLDSVRLAAKLTQGSKVRVQAFSQMPEALRWLLGVYEKQEIDDLIKWIDKGD